ncbi:MAG: TlpA family protein disulfide reductase [Rhodoglobus sp.]
MKVRLAGVLAVVLALAGCAAEDSLAQQYRDGSGQGYISGDGANTEIPVAERGKAIEFRGRSSTGETISSSDFAGSVHVINFWYASCPPCRSEAPDLRTLSEQYAEVPFIGVNTFDSDDAVAVFERKYGIAYPSIVDARTASVQLAFASAGVVAPKAVPTTIVIDRAGRVAARISGRIADPSILAAMIDAVVAEKTE